MDIGERQAKGNEKSQCFKGWETLVIYSSHSLISLVNEKPPQDAQL